MATVGNEQELRDAIGLLDPDITISNDFGVTNAFSINYETVLSSSGSILTWEGAASGTMFNVGAQGSLTIDSLILDGQGAYLKMVYVTGGRFTMRGDAVVRNVKSDSANRAITVGDFGTTSGGGEFIMEGGEVTGNELDVSVSISGGTMTMNGGARIHDNTCKGVDLVYSTLNMGGTSSIDGNIAERASAGVLCASNCVVNMGLEEGDTPSISNNESVTSFAGGIYLVDNSELNMNYGASVSNNTALQMAGGIGMNNSRLNMAGNSSVSENNSTMGGSGIFAQSGSLINLTEGAKIHANGVALSPGYGGGVFLQHEGTVLNMRDNAEITDNHAEGSGGGIYISSGSAVNMIVGSPKVSGNTTDGNGGGIFIVDGAVLTMSGGAGIENNTAAGVGAGVYNEGIIDVSGSPSITDGVYINGSAKALVVEGALGEEAFFQFEESDYVSESGLPVLVGVYGVDYQTPSGTEKDAFIKPESFSENVISSMNQTGIYFVKGIIVTFNANGQGVTNLPGRVIGEKEKEMKLPSMVPEREGYEFVAWNTLASGTGDSYLPGGEVVLPDADEMPLYAQWELIPPGECSVTFNANGQGVTNLPGQITGVRGSVINLPPAVPEREGYIFAGWNTLADGTGDTYLPGGEMELPDADEMLLYAQWELIPPGECAVTFNANGEGVTNLPGQVTGERGSVINLPLTIPEREGYIFAGWNTLADGTGDAYQSGSEVELPDADELPLYAQWEPIPPAEVYMIVFMPNGRIATNLPDFISASPGDTIILPTLIPICEGVEFDHWNTRADGSGERYMPGDSFTIPAIGAADADYSVVKTEFETVITLPLYAQWREVPMHSIRFIGNGQGASGIPRPITGASGAVVRLPIVKPVRPGYNFIGWNTLPGGDGVSYTPGQMVVMPLNGMTLYAQWSMVDIRVHFEANDTYGYPASSIPADIIAVGVYTLRLPDYAPKRRCYTFCGWNTLPDGRGTYYMPGGFVSLPIQNLTLYAIWSC